MRGWSCWKDKRIGEIPCTRQREAHAHVLGMNVDVPQYTPDEDEADRNRPGRKNHRDALEPFEFAYLFFARLVFLPRPPCVSGRRQWWRMIIGGNPHRSRACHVTGTEADPWGPRYIARSVVGPDADELHVPAPQRSVATCWLGFQE